MVSSVLPLPHPPAASQGERAAYAGVAAACVDLQGVSVHLALALLPFYLSHRRSLVTDSARLSISACCAPDG